VTTPLPTLETECFFIAPIGSDGSPERRRSDGVLEFIVDRAAEEIGLSAVRADQISEPGQITLQVIDHVLGARAAVADLTGLNPNVFYELAIRHTARLPVALIAEKGCDLPFDMAQMRTIFFDHTDLRSADACRKEIVAQLREALDRGAVDSPITTSVDVRALQSGSVVERNVAELVTTVEEVAKTQRAMAATIERGSRTGTVSPQALRDLETRYVELEKFVADQGDLELLDRVQGLSGPVRYLVRYAGWPLLEGTARRPPADSQLAAPTVTASVVEELRTNDALVARLNASRHSSE